MSQVAAGEPAGDAKRAHGRLGTGIHQTNEFHARHGVADQLGKFDFALGRRAEAGADFEHLLQRFDHCLRTMAQSSGPQEQM